MDHPLRHVKDISKTFFKHSNQHSWNYKEIYYKNYQNHMCMKQNHKSNAWAKARRLRSKSSVSFGRDIRLSLMRFWCLLVSKSHQTMTWRHKNWLVSFLMLKSWLWVGVERWSRKLWSDVRLEMESQSGVTVKSESGDSWLLKIIEIISKIPFESLQICL